MSGAVPAKTFEAKLFRYPGPGGWTFAPVPEAHAPPVTHGWGRTPVVASVDGRAWKTSVWRDEKYGTLLPVPQHIRGAKGDGDVVRVELTFEVAMDDLDRAPIARSRPKTKAKQGGKVESRARGRRGTPRRPPVG